MVQLKEIQLNSREISSISGQNLLSNTLAPLRSIEFLWLLSEAASAASVGEADPEARPAPPALLGPSFANRSSMSKVPLINVFLSVFFLLDLGDSTTFSSASSSM